MRAWVSGLVLAIVAGCSPSSLDDFRHEGEALQRKLALELKEVRTREDLSKAVPKLKKRYEEFTDLMIAAKEYHYDHPEEAGLQEIEASEQLMQELKRIYAMEGGREMLERAQREALIRLDAFEQKRLKKNN